MKKSVTVRKTVIIGIICFISAALLSLGGVYLFAGKTVFKLAQIDFLLNKYYYGEVSENDLRNGLYKGYISALDDKYSSYLEPEDSKIKFDSLEGLEGGLGMSVCVHPDNNDFYVVMVSENGPADKAGISPGDEITAVDGVDVAENINECYKKLKGNIGDIINITVSRNGSLSEKKVIISKFDLQSVYYRKVGKYGYILIDEFNTTTVEQFKNAVNRLIGENVEGFIFDVMNNGGGTVDSVAEILDYLLPKGDMIYTEDISSKKKVIFKSDSEEIDLPMTVLTNRNTASASELFAESIRDYNKGVLVGQKTYGKGVMQKTFRLFDGSSVKFTVAKVFAKNGVDYNGIGIEPDISVELNEHESKYFYLLPDGENPYIKAAVGWLDENKQ